MKDYISMQHKELVVSKAESTTRAITILSGLVKGLVNLPEQVHVDAKTTDEQTVLYLNVSANDRGLVIGKGGRTLRSLRTVMAALSIKTDENFRLELVEEPIN